MFENQHSHPRDTVAVVHPGLELPIDKFRRIARTVKRQLHWNCDWTQDIENCCQEGKNVPPSLNVAAFRSTSAQLPWKARFILTKPSHLRSDSELQFLHLTIGRLKCFKQYGYEILNKLSKVLHFGAYEKGRVIYRQGHRAQGFYFIVSGCLAVQQETDKFEAYAVVELKTGASFGGATLLKKGNFRSETVVCKEYSELLSMDLDYFDSIIRTAQEEDRAARSKIIAGLSVLSVLQPSCHNMLANASNIVQFRAFSVVLKDLSVVNEVVYFVIKGHCSVIQKFDHLEQPRNHSATKVTTSKFRSPNQPSDDLTGTKDLKTKWLLLRTLRAGDFFGVGEGPTNSSVICNELKLQCLAVQATVLAKHSKGQLLNELQTAAKDFFPSLRDAMRSYSTFSKWKVYKSMIVESIIENKRHRRAKFPSVVPLVLRNYEVPKSVNKGPSL